MNQTMKLLLSFGFYMLAGFGISITIFAGIGVSSFNALNLSLATVLEVEIGTVTTVLNIFFLSVYALLTHFKLQKKYLMQFSAAIAFGSVINIFTYYNFNNLVLTHYLTKVAVFCVGVTISGISTGMILYLDILTFPIESVCTELSSRLDVPFHKLRYSFDILCVTGSIVMTKYFRNPVNVREGTLISMFLLTFWMHTTVAWMCKKIPKYANWDYYSLHNLTFEII